MAEHALWMPFAESYRSCDTTSRTGCRRVESTSAMTTFAPSVKKRFAQARPIPRAAPVMTATLSTSLISSSLVDNRLAERMQPALGIMRSNSP